MAKGGAVVAPSSANWAMVDGKDDCVAAIRVKRFDAGLLARALLAKDKLAAVKIFAALTQKNRKLKRENEFAIEILMQTVEIACTIFQKQGRRPRLAGVMALLEEIRKPLRVMNIGAKPFGPLIRERGQLGIDRIPELLNGLGEWIGEIFIFAAAESIARHFNARAKAAIVVVVAGDLVASFRRKYGWDQREATLIELPARRLPDRALAIER